MCLDCMLAVSMCTWMVDEPVGALVCVEVEMQQGVNEDFVVGAHGNNPAKRVDAFPHSGLSDRNEHVTSDRSDQEHT